MNKIQLHTNILKSTMEKLKLLADVNGLQINQVIDMLVAKQKKTKLF